MARNGFLRADEEFARRLSEGDQDVTGKLADGILRGFEQAVAYAEGTADESECVVYMPSGNDTKAIRAGLGMRQEDCRKVPVLDHEAAPMGAETARAYSLVIGRDPIAAPKSPRPAA